MDFSRFLHCYPPERGRGVAVDARALAQEIHRHFKVRAPQALVCFWERIGAGYFGDRDLYFFGDGQRKMPRDSLLDWNRQDYWSKILPRPSRGGPLFFAETCFGDQLGFLYCDGLCQAILFGPDEFKTSYVGEPFDELFKKVLTRRQGLVDATTLRRLRKRFGPLPAGMHYAPIVSPLLGGSRDPHNFHVETPPAHMMSAMAAFKAYEKIQQIADGDG